MTNNNNNRTPYQDKIIRRYFDNRDNIMEEKVGNLMAELYLASGTKRTKLWQRVALALKNLSVTQEEIDKLIASDKPELLTKYVGR